MSRKYPKKVRNKFKRQQAAADAFVKEWTKSGLSDTLIMDYKCFLNCGEAETYSGLFRAFGHVDTAESILADHGEDCDTPHYHAAQGVWTFTLQPGGNEAEGEDEYVIVADGKSGVDAEIRATEYLRAHLKKKYKTYFWIHVVEVEVGTPGSLTLYDWTDLRKAA